MINGYLRLSLMLSGFTYGPTDSLGPSRVLCAVFKARVPDEYLSSANLSK